MKFTIPLTPISKKNSMRIFRPNGMNRPLIVPSEKYKNYESEALQFIPKCPQPIDYPVNVKAVFYMPTRRKCDLVNMQEAILDVMVKGGVIEDDNYSIVQSMDGSRVLYDKNNPRTEVEITTIDERDKNEN